MEFCPKCGSLMLPKGNSLLCEKCGHVEELRKPEEYTLVKKVEEKMGDVNVVEEEKMALPTVKTTCPSCGNHTAYWWILQTRRADEPPTRFYRCTKCGKTWREYA